jgi:hypothetical protein
MIVCVGCVFVCVCVSVLCELCAVCMLFGWCMPLVCVVVCIECMYANECMLGMHLFVCSIFVVVLCMHCVWVHVNGMCVCVCVRQLRGRMCIVCTMKIVLGKMALHE